MYKYYQVQEKGKWKPIIDTPQTVQQVLDKGAKKLTILAMSEEPDEHTTAELITYKGPLYFDIDCKEDIHFAIRSTRDLVAKLIALDVPKEHILVFCSGSKGMHVIVDERTFSTGRAVKGLPAVYKAVARELYVFGIDWQVYSGGRGVCWRLVNQKREDGNFRVGISHAELDVLNETEYTKLVAAPREEITFPSSVERGCAVGLAVIYERCKKEIIKENVGKKQKGASHLSKEALKILQDKAPQCINDLCNGKASNSANFNEYALQLAAYTAGAEIPEALAERLTGELAESTSSSSYSSARDRIQHIKGLAGYCGKGGKGYKFSCGGIKSVITTNPCNGCPLDNVKTEAQQAVDRGEFGIEERPDGYYIVGKESERKITTFTMNLLNKKYERVHDISEQEACVSTQIEIKGSQVNCKGKIELNIPETAWLSRHEFMNVIKGYDNVGFLGDDKDVPKLRLFVFGEQGDHIGQTTTVPTVGITSAKVGASDLMVYVEESGSLNQLGVRDTHELSTYVQNSPELLGTKLPEQGDVKASEALLALMRMNEPKTMGLLIGWHCAAHLRTHFIKSYNQFPTVNIWGPAGVGKTQTAIACCFLNGINYTGNHSPILVPSSTKYALEDYCSSSTTIPRILDEANQSRMLKTRWQEYVEITKAAFGNLGVHKGRRIDKVIAASSKPISAPLITLAEQNVSDAALLQRSISVFLTSRARKKKECYEAFETARKLRSKTLSIAKALMLLALKTPVQDAQDMVDRHMKHMPADFEDRVRFGFCVTLAGLDFLKEACKRLELSTEVLKEIDKIQDAINSHIDREVIEITRVKSKSEVDRIIETMGQMARLTLAGALKEFVKDDHYAVVNGNLILDLPMAHAMYTNYSNRNGLTVHIRDYSGFHALLREEVYYIDDAPVKGFSVRPCVILDGKLLKEKGIDIDMFGPEF